MARIEWKGNKATVQTYNGLTVYVLKSVKGIQSKKLINVETQTVVNGSIQSLQEAKTWLHNYYRVIRQH